MFGTLEGDVTMGLPRHWSTGRTKNINLYPPWMLQALENSMFPCRYNAITLKICFFFLYFALITWRWVHTNNKTEQTKQRKE